MLLPEVDCSNMVGIVNVSLGTQLPVHSLSLVVNATSTATTITIPASALPDDFAILCDRSSSTSGIPNPVTPTGWNSIAGGAATSNFSGGVRSSITYKQLVSGDPGSTITGMPAGSGGTVSKIMLIVRPLYKRSVIQFSPGGFSLTTTAFNSTATTVTNNTIGSTTLNLNNAALAIALYATQASSITNRGSTGPYTMTEVAGATANTHYLKYYTANYGTNFSNNETISITTAAATRIVLLSGIITIK